MACTATITKTIRKEIIQSLEMSGCVCVSVSPDRPNIFYEVKERTNIHADFCNILMTLQKKLINAPRVIVYCRCLNMCSDLYAHFHYELGASSYYPPGVPEVSDNRLFGMFHANTPQHNKDVILQSLLVPDGVVRVVFATVALGMGINLQEVNTIIHYGAPRSIEDYFQESGRGGRNGDSACSVIYWKPSDCPMKKDPSTPHEHELIDVRRYLENTTVCRRWWLLNYFEWDDFKQGDKCCDICYKMKLKYQQTNESTS